MERDSNVIEAERSLALLKAQAQALPSALTHSLEADLQPLAQDCAVSHWVVTGVGASEGPARLCAAALRACGLDARFVSTTYFLGDAPPRAEGLIAVSQRLSPNGRIALAHAPYYRKVFLVTSARLSHAHIEPVMHGPAEEPPLFLRVLGPGLAAATCLRLAARIATACTKHVPSWWEKRSQVGAEVHKVLQTQVTAHHAPLGLVGMGEDLELLAGAQGKLVEGLFADRPAIWDACAFVHGPYQSSRQAPTPMSLLACSSEHNSSAKQIWTRLSQLPPHELVQCTTNLEGPLAYFAYDAYALALVLGRLQTTPQNLLTWPGKHDDGPMYEIDTPHA